MLLIIILSKNINASGIPVLDAASLARAVIDGTQQAIQITNQGIQIKQNIEELKQGYQSLQQLDPSAFDALLEASQFQSIELQKMINQAREVSYNIDHIKKQIEILFPNDTEMTNMTSAEYESYHQKWTETLMDSAKVAMESQTSIARINQRNDEIQKILTRSNKADGEVRQIQANTQMLSVVSQQLNDLHETMALSGRTTAMMAAQSSAEIQAARIAKEKMMQDYGVRKIPYIGPTQLPQMRQP